MMEGGILINFIHMMVSLLPLDLQDRGNLLLCWLKLIEKHRYIPYSFFWLPIPYSKMIR